MRHVKRIICFTILSPVKLKKSRYEKMTKQKMQSWKLREIKRLNELRELTDANLLTLSDGSGGFRLDFNSPIDRMFEKLDIIEQPQYTLKLDTKKLREYDSDIDDSVKIGSHYYSTLRIALLLKFLGEKTVKIYHLEIEAPIRLETIKGTAYLAPRRISDHVTEEQLKTIPEITTFTS
jgi:hypothetical protein